jgi:hypothetical protein
MYGVRSSIPRNYAAGVADPCRGVDPPTWHYVPPMWHHGDGPLSDRIETPT